MRIFTTILFLTFCSSAFASAAGASLSRAQSHAFRQWFVRIIAQQLEHGPTPRWQQRDCASLVRFAAMESLKSHSANWLRANGLPKNKRPPEVNLTPIQSAELAAWNTIEKGRPNRSHFVSAIGLIQDNSILVSRNFNDAKAGDLIFFDQGDDQHLMVWMGSYIAYHTGRVSQKDNGMRKISLHDLMQWKDSRWRPDYANRSFIGIFRLAFLSD